MKWLVLLEGKQSSRLSDRCLKNPQNHFNVELMLINIRQKAFAPSPMPLFVPL